MAIHVVQGERERVADCRSLARFELRGIPPMAAGAARIRVTFQVDADGLLSVSAREQATGIESSVVVKPSYGLTDDQVARMLQDSYAHAAEDMAARAFAEAAVEADQLAEQVRNAVAADGDLLEQRERAAIDAALAEVALRRRGDDAGALRASTEALNRASEGFAARRMDRTVSQALAGRSVDTLVGE
jgi:molecular chaperone HscA